VKKNKKKGKMKRGRDTSDAIVIEDETQVPTKKRKLSPEKVSKKAERKKKKAEERKKRREERRRIQKEFGNRSPQRIFLELMLSRRKEKIEKSARPCRVSIPIRETTIELFQAKNYICKGEISMEERKNGFVTVVGWDKPVPVGQFAAIVNYLRAVRNYYVLRKTNLVEFYWEDVKKEYPFKEETKENTALIDAVSTKVFGGRLPPAYETSCVCTKCGICVGEDDPHKLCLCGHYGCLNRELVKKNYSSDSESDLEPEFDSDSGSDDPKYD